MSLTNTFETTVLTWLLTASSATRPTSWYIGLFTAIPNEAGGGTEVSGTAYVRKAVTFTVTGDTASNNAAVEWPVAGGSWGTITSIAIFDAVTGWQYDRLRGADKRQDYCNGRCIPHPSGRLRCNA
jgi:hypothetical protein